MIRVCKGIRSSLSLANSADNAEPVQGPPDRQIRALDLPDDLQFLKVPGRDNPSLHPIKGGDAAGLMAKLDAARDRMTKVVGRVSTAASTVWSWSRRACRSTAGRAE
jgi:hypothetical protein